MLNLHDTHLHLDLYKDINGIVNQINHYKLYTIAVTNHPDIYVKLSQMIDSKYIRVGLGFHPELVEDYYHRREFFFSLIRRSKYIGEIGLDYSNKNISSKEKQLLIFTKTIETCKEIGGKVISIHSKKAERDILDIIGPVNKIKVIMHWYSGSIKIHNEMIKNGYFFSFNYKMLTSKKGTNTLLRTPLSRIVLESDGPFASIDKETYKPNMMSKTFLKICEILEIEEPLLKKILNSNFKSLISF